jgi:hypothetical protein
MNWDSMLLWGFAGSVLVSIVITGSQALGFTRMDLPILLGTMLTAGRDPAKRVGMALHVAFGLFFALCYCAIFESWGLATWWAGGAIGVCHGVFLLLAGMSVLPSFHPRMASEEHGPTPTRLLEPPGLLGLNYGRRTPHTVMVAHLFYGVLLGAFYHLA